MTLYSFHRLEAKLDQLGFPKISASSGFQAIRTDFGKAYKAGQIEFRDDGVFLNDNGLESKGYIYEPSYKVQGYNSLPKFHITKCFVLKKFLERGIFHSYYEFSQYPTNDIVDRETGDKHPESVLQLCKFCSKQITSQKVTDTEKFFETLENQTQRNAVIQVDINGYTKDWRKISKAYRESKNYTCETCSIQPKSRLDRHFWETHHIDGDKTHNHTLDNFKCLCILCHSNVDERHKDNSSKGSRAIKRKEFVKRYRGKLLRLGNQYLT